MDLADAVTWEEPAAALISDASLLENAGDGEHLHAIEVPSIDEKAVAKSRFHSLADGIWREGVLSLAEMRVYSLELAIRDKPDWERKVAQPGIAAAWRKDFLASRSGRPEEADWALAHVAWLARTRGLAGAGAVIPSAVRGAVEARGLLAPSEIAALVAGAAALERGPRDYHPGSHRQVVNLVHPSLWPIAYGVTPLHGGGVAPLPAHLTLATPADVASLRAALGLPREEVAGVATQLHRDAWEISRAAFEASFARLTAEYEAHSAGDDYNFEQQDALREFKQRFLPSRQVLSVATSTLGSDSSEGDEDEYRDAAPTASRVNYSNEYDVKRALWSTRFQWLPAEVSVDACGTSRFVSYINNLDPATNTSLYETLGAVFTRFLPLFERALSESMKGPSRLIHYPMPDVELMRKEWIAESKAKDQKGRLKAKGKAASVTATLDDDEDEWHDRFWQARRDIPIPQPRVPVWSAPPSLPPLSLCKRQLQVIVKMANIELTPARPRYNGGSWHLEGAANERIVATGICYYAQDNISPSMLHFRVGVHEPSYGQDDSWLVEGIFGIDDGDALVQSRGHVRTDEGLCLVWPNHLQHRVAPFALADPTRPGHRKILVFFLVDPDYRVLSSRDVPQQQPSAICRALRGVLPPDLALRVAEFSTLSHLQAVAQRLELMAERKFTVKAGDELVRREFSLCEH